MMPRRPFGAAWTRPGSAGVAAAAAAMLVLSSPAEAANSVQITKLSDVAFNTITNFASDSVSSQSVCIYSGTAIKGYNVRALGSGTSSAFTLASGGHTLAYEVEWSSSSGQTSGTSLSPNVALTGLKTTATKPTCNSGPSTTASLVVLLRSTTIQSATAGSYSGTLTLVFAPE